MRRLLLAALLLGGGALLPAADDPLPADDVQDVVFLGDGRPAFIRLHVRNGEGSAFTGYDAFMERLFRFLDRDGSGGLNRTEAGRVPSVAQLNQYLTGNPFIVEARAARPGAMPAAPMSVEDLDVDRDGRVTPDEMKDYYVRNAVGSLVVFNQTAAGSASAASDLVFGMLDTDKDGKLSREELTAADAEVMRLDRDDDELISAVELGIGPARAPGEQSGTITAEVEGAKRPEPAMGLEMIPRGDRRLTARMDAARKVVAKYDKDKDSRLTAAEVGLAKGAFAKADRNRDGKLDALEVGRWLMAAPDSEQTIRLTAPAVTSRVKPPVPWRAADNLLTLGPVQLTILGQPLTENLRVDYKSQVLGQFRTFDVDKLGYVTRKQLDTQTGASMRALIAVADRNSDGRLTRPELVEYLDLIAGASSAQVSVALSSSGQGLFQALDTNGDGYLSMRELRNSWGRLSSFDADGDAAVARGEFPTQVRLTVGRGGSQAVPPGEAGPEGGRPVPTLGPLWFRKMDRNGDGDVSRSEWLGEAADFDAVDKNRDGLLGVEEAEAFDANRRK